MVIQAWHGEIERFLYREARLLDSGEFDSWLGLLAPDIHYWMPVVENRMLEDLSGAYGPERMAYFDDHLPDLQRRIERYRTRTAWSENPPTRHVHIISNIEVEPAERDDAVVAHSVFVNYRNRGERDEDVLFGRRRDILCRHAGSWLLARRRIVIAQNVLLAKNINTFF